MLWVDQMTPGPDTVRDFVMTIAHGGFEHPPYITTDYIEVIRASLSEPRASGVLLWLISGTEATAAS